MGKVLESKAEVRHALEADIGLCGYKYRIKTTNKARFFVVCDTGESLGVEQKFPFTLYPTGNAQVPFEVGGWKYDNPCSLAPSSSPSQHGSEWMTDKIEQNVSECYIYSPRMMIDDMRREYGVIFST